MKIISPITNSMHWYSLLLVLLFSAGTCLGQGNTYKAKISGRVQAQMSQSDPIDVVLQLESLDMRPYTRGIEDKATKGRIVYRTLTDHAASTQAPVRKLLEQWNVPYKSYWVANIIATRLTVRQVLEIAKQRAVVRILSDAPVTFTRPIPANDYSSISLRGEPQVTWGIQRILADSVWAKGIKGHGVVVGGQDTGYKWDVDGIKDKYRGFDGTTVDHNYSWHDAISDYNPVNGDSSNPCGLNLEAPCDDHGHGTHTMGTMVGENDTLQYGVAPEATWIGCRCMERGWGKPSTYIDCFQWFIAPTNTDNKQPDPAMAPAVINNSWGCPPNEGCNPDNYDIMRQVVDNVKAAGIVVVVSAGNDGGGGCSTIRNPAAIYEGSFTVGALSPNDTIARFSSRGEVLSDSSHRTKPDITAPGVRVLSQLPDGSFRAWNGTSMAGPHVAGVVALMISANPSLAGHVDVIEEIITSTARRKFSPIDSCDTDPMTIPNNVYGYGVINALKAVKKALAWHPVKNNNTLDNGGIVVWPNPTNGLLEFDFVEVKDTEVQDILFSTLGGKVVKTAPYYKDSNRWKYDFSGYPSGVYLYSIRLGNRSVDGRFIKI